MRIPPKSYFGVFSEIIVAYINPSYKSNHAIYHHDFPVIAIVNPAVQCGEKRR
ncbi:hypothetical protein D3C84_1294190 [compost metagenome]